ncbi:hypothetical protein [Pseudokordiimonas caeni]|uniref:hypothetical protein n=1 Tax=Pseudokordiimonas caeni TaxID=2997908 RepID=UPI002810BCE9|nr:hypothetical protein [Pseudokordiimonas caeni]
MMFFWKYSGPPLALFLSATIVTPMPALAQSAQKPLPTFGATHQGMSDNLTILNETPIPAPRQDAASSPFLDIQWESPLVQSMLDRPIGVCQADKDPNVQPVEDVREAKLSSTQTAGPSLLRAIFYMAYDYYGMGLNHYFMLRHDVMFDRAKVAAAKKAVNYKDPPFAPEKTQSVLYPKDAITLLPDPKSKNTVEIPEVVPSKNGGPPEWSSFGTRVDFRHTIIDPFDLSMVADTLDGFVLRQLATPDKAKSVTAPIVVNDIHGAYRFGYYRLRSGQNVPVGLRHLTRYSYPGVAYVCDRSSFAACDRRGESGNPAPLTDHAHYSQTGINMVLEYSFWPSRTQISFPPPSVLRLDTPMICAQWRWAQERKHAGQETEADRLLEALMKRAKVDDRRVTVKQNAKYPGVAFHEVPTDDFWIIPGRGL